MAFDWKKTIQTIAPFIGTIITNASGPLAPLASAGIALVSEAILGKPDGTEGEISAAIEKGLPPEAIAAIQEKSLNFKLEMEKLKNEARKTDIEEEKVYAGDRLNARDMQKAALQQEDKVAKRFIYEYATFVTGVAFIYIFAITFNDIPEKNIRFADTILGFLLGTLVAGVVNFFFGSSSGSDQKTSIMANILSRFKN